MDEHKDKGLEDLLAGLGIGEEEPPLKPLLEEAPTEASVGDNPNPQDVVEHFLVGLLLYLDPSYAIETRQDGERLYVEILGGDLSRIIGREGKTLAALEFLVNTVLAKHFGSQYRATLDAAGYKRRQEERLKKRALEAAAQVMKSGQPLELPPMRPAERRIIHMTLKQHPEVTTESIGEGEDRHVVVKPRPPEDAAESA